MIALLNANAAQIPLADDSVHCIVTSPPYYGLRSYQGKKQPQIWGGDKSCEHSWNYSSRTMQTGGINPKQLSNKGVDGYGWQVESAFCSKCGAWYGCLGEEPTPDLYISNMCIIGEELQRVLRPDGTLWMVIGDSYNGSGGAGGDYNKGGLKEGQPRYKGRNVASLKPKDLIGIPWMLAFAYRDELGFWLRKDIIWVKTNAMPEGGAIDRPTSSHEYIFLFSKSRRYYYDRHAIAEPAKYAGDRRDQRPDSRRGDDKMKSMNNPTPQMRNKRDVWIHNTGRYKGAHYATFPGELIVDCIKAGTSEAGCCMYCGAPYERIVRREQLGERDDTGRTHGLDEQRLSSPGAPPERGWEAINHTERWAQTCRCKYPPLGLKRPIVFDPFVGSGTTCEVARALNCDSIGMDISFEYLRDNARARLDLDKLEAWQEGIIDNSDVSDLPLFNT